MKHQKSTKTLQPPPPTKKRHNKNRLKIPKLNGFLLQLFTLFAAEIGPSVFFEAAATFGWICLNKSTDLKGAFDVFGLDGS